MTASQASPQKRKFITSPLWSELHPFLTVIKELVVVATVVSGGLWAVYTYTEAQRSDTEKQTRLRLMELQKPYLERQTQLYAETTQIVGKLLANPVESPEWTDAERRFISLQKTELRVFADSMVTNQADVLVEYLAKARTDPKRWKDKLDAEAFNLAEAMRLSIKAVWLKGFQAREGGATAKY